MEVPTNAIRQEDLDQLKVEILNKINRRFFESEGKEKKNKSLDEDEHLIQPAKYDQCDDMLLDKRSTREPLEQLMAEEYADYSKNTHSCHKRPRLYSGCIQTGTSATSEVTNESHETFILKRDQPGAMHSKGYFFLAVVFGMMCASSYVANKGG